MTWVNGRIAASVGTADSYVSFPILYLFIFRKTLVAKIRIIFSDQAHSSLKKRGFAKIQFLTSTSLLVNSHKASTMLSLCSFILLI